MGAFLAFIGAVLGALLTGVFAESYRRHRDRQGIASSIRGEISAILDMTKRRNYVATFAQIVADLRAAKPSRVPDILQRPIALDPIISRVAERIGILDGDLPERIVSFYSRLMGIRLDIQKLADGIWDYDLNVKAAVIDEDLGLWAETHGIGMKVCGDLTDVSNEKWFGSLTGRVNKYLGASLIVAATIAVVSFLFINSYVPKYGLIYNVMAGTIEFTKPCPITASSTPTPDVENGYTIVPPPPKGYTLDRPLPPLPRGAVPTHPPPPQASYMCGVSFPYRWILAFLAVGLCGIAIWPRRQLAQ